MAIYGDNIISGKANDFYCDASADVSDLPTFAEEWNLKPGSSCYCIGTGDLYMMKSDGTWKKQ